jgi:hypothetical protein
MTISPAKIVIALIAGAILLALPAQVKGQALDAQIQYVNCTSGSDSNNGLGFSQGNTRWRS